MIASRLSGSDNYLKYLRTSEKDIFQISPKILSSPTVPAYNVQLVRVVNILWLLSVDVLVTRSKVVVVLEVEIL